MEKEMLLEKIKEVIAEVKITNGGKSELAKKIDISPGIITQLEKNEYNLNEGNEVYNKIERYLEMREKKNTFKDIVFVKTSVSTKLLNFLEYWQIQHAFAIVRGAAGVGKTETAKEYAKRTPTVIYFQVTNGLERAKGLLKKICAKLNVSNRGTVDELFDRVVEKLEDTDKMLVIDEAQQLKDEGIECVKNIYDLTGIAVVLMGNEEIYQRFSANQSVKNARWHSRGFTNFEITKDDISLEDIKLVFEGVDEDAVAYLYKLVKKSTWGLRGAVNVYKNAITQGDISVNGLLAATKLMGVEIK